VQLAATGESLVETEENETMKEKHDPLLEEQNYQSVSRVKSHAGDESPLLSLAGEYPQTDKECRGPQIHEQSYQLSFGSELHGDGGGKFSNSQSAQKQLLAATDQAHCIDDR